MNGSALYPLALVLVLLIVPRPSRAAVTFDVLEVGGNVVATGSGSLNLTGLFPIGTGTISARLEPSSSTLMVGPGNTAAPLVDSYIGLSGPPSLGPGGLIIADSGSGDRFGIFDTTRAMVPAGYSSGAPLAGTSTWSAASFASLGLTPGTYLFTAPNDTLTINIGPATVVGGVPEPSTLALYLTMLAGCAFVRWRRTAD